MTGDLTFLICSSSPGNHSFEKHDLRDVIIKQLYFCLILSLWTTGLAPPCPWWSHGFSEGIFTVSVHTVKYLVQCNSQNFKFKRNISPYTQFKPCIGRQLQMVDRGTAHGELLIFSPTLCMNSSSILRTNISILQDWVCGVEYRRKFWLNWCSSKLTLHSPGLRDFTVNCLLWVVGGGGRRSGSFY